MAGTPEITLARNGQRIALVYPTYKLAHDDFEHLVELAPDAAKVNASSGKLALEFERGSIRLVGNADQLRGYDYDQVIVHPDAWTEETSPLLAAAVATTGGVVRVEGESNGIIACAECGQQLAVEGLWSIEHNEDGTHTAIPGTPPADA